MGVDQSERVHAANLEKVDHVVVMMLENRSFDHMLGYLSLTGRRPDIDGLRSGFANEYQGRTYPVHHLGTTALDVDPDHSADAVDEQVAGGSMGGFVASDWLMGLLHITGTFGSPAYSQYGVLPLMQLVSVTGMYGLTFLVMWFASAVNAVWEHGFQWRATRLLLAVFGSVLAAVFAFGFARLSLAAPTSPTVKAATITISPSVFNQANDLDWMTFNRATSQQRAAFRPRFNATVDQMLARTQTALSRGAKLVVWQEQSALVLPEDRQNAISRAAALARSNGAYLEIWLGVLNQSQSLPYFRNQAILISPAGTVVWTYNKTYPVLGGDSAITLRGSGVLPVADTPYGRLTTAICNDLDYPGLLRQAGRNGADILLAPNHEMYSFETSYRVGEAVYRAIENGTSLVRPTGDGISLMTDYLGRVIASQNYSASNNGIMLASVPTNGVSTIYSRIGDAFAYLCTLGVVLGIHMARVAKRREKRVPPPTKTKEPQAV